MVLSENIQETLERLSDTDPLLSVSMANDTTGCSDQADQAFLPSASAVGDKVIVSVKVIDLETSKILRTIKVQGSDNTISSFNDLMLSTWRAIEGGLAPESWIWRNGVGFCDRLKSIISERESSSCAGVGETFKLMGDEATGNRFIDNCQKTWRRNQMEPVCRFQCVGGKPTELTLYKRLDATSVIEEPRSSSEQRAFVERLKRSYGLTDEELAKFDIKTIYPDQDLKDPQTVFDSAARDIQACLPALHMGALESGAVDHSNADDGSKNISFSNDHIKLILELYRWSSDGTRWNFLSLHFN
ncbi:hypothetical protein ELI36_19030 [Rhizobium ruizarguesonis]|uniref:hypothetical protein n=1 Tax=Rhizobium ruizarguesonis TaxID=2081791 RepID=UPI00102FD41C|nr:hypothetical protein [Rhizobium ruizarguesonis]TAV34376.1 hypothetical protein ELI36_19030 [Rhizobium ruizarguesonis]